MLKRSPAEHTLSAMAVEWQVGRCRARRAGQRVTTMKSVPSPVSSPRPWSDTTSDEPGTISCGNLVDHVLRNIDARERFGRRLRRRQLADRLLDGLFAPAVRVPYAGSFSASRFAFGGSPGSDTTFQRNVEPSSRYSIAVKTWVPNGCSGCSMVIGGVEQRLEILPHVNLLFLAADEDRDRPLGRGVAGFD